MAAIEWSLDSAILIASAEDIQSRHHWSEVFEPYEHQVRNLLTFCRRAPVALVADDVGLGKTITAGLIISELIARGKVERILVLAPKILLPQWKEELETKFKIPTATGSGPEANGYLHVAEGAFVTTYDSARARLDSMAKHGFDMIVMDEAHKLRNLFGPNGPPKLALAVEEALTARAFRYVLMLTATPIQNRLWDMYSLVHLLCRAKGHQNPLGSAEAFTRKYIADGKSSARRLRPGRKDEFRRHLSQYIVRARRQDCGLHFPTRRVLPRKTRPTSEEDELLELVRGLIQELNPLVQSSVAQALMSSPAALAAQLRNMADRGSISQHLAQQAEEIAGVVHHSSKLSALLELVDELRSERPGDWRVVVFTGRKATQEYIGTALGEVLQGAGVGYIRGGRAAENERAIQAYRADPPTCHVLVSTDAGAEGVNLQAGNVLVNFDLPWNPMVLEQRIGRVQRLGTEHQYVIVYNLVLAGSIEEHVVARLSEKLLAVSDTLGDIEGILEAVNDDSRSYASESMEGRIRSLVLLALQGRNVEQATEQAHASIERAKQMYEEEKENVEENLGSLDRMHEEGPRMPQLTATEPRLSERDFTLGALEAAGTTLHQLSDDIWRAERAGQAPRRVMFQRHRQGPLPSHIIGGGILDEVYRSGSPPFERLVGEWGRNAEHHVIDRTSEGQDVAEQLARDWLARFPDIALDSVTCRPGEPCFHGTISAQVGVAVSHDKYEKLIDLPIGDVSRAVELVASEPSAAPFRLADISEKAGTTLRPQIEADPDVRAFTGFYARRLEEELERAGSDRDRRLNVNAQFECTLNARVVAARGVVEAVQQVDLAVSFDGLPAGALALVIDPGAARVLQAPEEERCVVNGRQYPAPLMSTCDVTGARALTRCLIASELSGLLVVPSASERCAESGRLMASDELEVDEASGRRVGSDLLLRSAVSGRKCLERELVRCEVTGDLCLPDEVKKSEISGRVYRSDQSTQGGINLATGHSSEFERCALSLEWLLPEELVASDVSGTRFDRRRAVNSERPPHRVGLPTETVPCQASGKRLLSDEVVQSAVSGRWLDAKIAMQSAQSERHAFPDELVTCAVSGRRVLPAETETCAVTGQRAVPEFMVKSAISGSHCLSSESVTSPETGRVVLKTEAETSEISGLLIPIDEGTKCAVSGTFAEKSRMVRADVSNEYALADHVVVSRHSGRTCITPEAVLCDWTGHQLLPDEAAVCKWTSLRASSTEMDDEQVLLPVRPFIENGEEGASARQIFRRAFRSGVLARLVGSDNVTQEFESPTKSIVIVRSSTQRMLSGTSDVRIAVYQQRGAAWEPLRVMQAELRALRFKVISSGDPGPEMANLKE